MQINSRLGFFHVFVSNVINRIVSFAYTIFIVRILSKYEYGTFEYANNIYYLLILLSGIGISSAFLQLGSECADNKVKMTDYYAFSNRFGITVNFVLSILILLVGLFIPLPIQVQTLLVDDGTITGFADHSRFTGYLPASKFTQQGIWLC